jgi:hypothetical protein
MAVRREIVPPAYREFEAVVPETVTSPVYPWCRSSGEWVNAIVFTRIII